jgi:predicted nucleic acid-binding protein
MMLVIDSNRLMAGLLKDSVSRRIILHKNLTFYAPDYIIMEITKHRKYLADKIEQSEEHIDVILYSLLENITLLPYEEFEKEMTDAIEAMKDIEPKDAPFLAVGMAIRADGIWTEDRHFERQNMLRVFTTKDLISQIWDD